MRGRVRGRSGFVEVRASKCRDEVPWGLLRDWLGDGCGVGGRCEGESASVEHTLREVVGVGVGGHSEVAEHGVGLPAAEKLDDVRVDAGAKQGCGAARAEAPGAEQERIDAGEVLDVDGGMAQGVGDERGRGLSGLAGAVIVGA